MYGASLILWPYYVALNVKPDVTHFVGGKYPLEFLLEFQDRFGALMFSSTKHLNLNDEFYAMPKLGNETIQELRGSMLPFSADVSDAKAIINTLESSDDHCAVKQWTIHLDSSVSIKRAGIIASWLPSPDICQSVEAWILPRGSYFVKNEHETDDLLLWMGRVRPESEKHAVCLSRYTDGDYFGIILERISPSETDFVKIGGFMTDISRSKDDALNHFNFESSVDVDWRVL